jgi:hypothetical protein
VGVRFSAPVQTGPGAHPASCTMGTGSFPGVKSGRGVTLTPHPLLVTWSRKGRSIPLLPLWAVRPVQSLSACTRVHFTFLPLCFQTPSYYLSAYEISFHVTGSPTDISHHGTGHRSSFWLMLLKHGQENYGSHSFNF